MQSSDDPKPKMRVLVGMTGASGALYAKRLLQQLATLSVETHLIMSPYAKQVVDAELPDGLELPQGVVNHQVKSMQIPFASGSNPPDAMVIVPCSMGSMARIAHGTSEDAMLRLLMSSSKSAVSYYWLFERHP